MRRWLAVVSAVGFAFSLAACGSSDSKDTSSGKTGGGSTVTIKNFSFSPTPLNAKVGETITVSNTDSSIHTFTANDGSLDTGDIGSGATGTVTVTKAGEITYHCSIHDYMKGVIQVDG